MTRRPCLVAVDASNFDALPCCGIKCATHPGRMEKKQWFEANLKLGLRAKQILDPDSKPVGYIEYVPGEFAWRAVDARGYMFIHCVWMHSRKNQRKGWGSLMIQDCIEDARRSGMNGVAVVSRLQPWLADRRLFLANGFEPVDAAPPDYELLVRKFAPDPPPPAFKKDLNDKLARYGRGLTIIRCSQCPYVAKFASEIGQTAAEEYGITSKIVNLQSCHDAQEAPTPYGVFALIYDGRLLADHQISRTRFRNIMRNTRAGTLKERRSSKLKHRS